MSSESPSCTRGLTLEVPDRGEVEEGALGRGGG